jgi:hypothetical protein
MRRQALIAGGACAVLPIVAVGCSLMASLDGLTGGDAGSAGDATHVEASGGSDAGAGDAGAVDGGRRPDAGGGDAPATGDGGSPGSDVSTCDAPGADASLEDVATAAPDAPPEATPDVAEEPPPVAPITFVQVAASSPQGSSLSVTAKLAQAQVAGDLLVVAVGWNDTTSTVSQVVDTAGDAFELAIGPATLGSDLTQSIYYAANVAVAAAGTNGVTVSFVQAANVVDLRVLEYRGLSATGPLDQTANATGNSAGPAASPPVTTTSAHALVFGAGMSTDLYSGAGTGFTERLVTSDGDIVEDRIVSAVGSYAATAPLADPCEWVMQVAVFH